MVMNDVSSDVASDKYLYQFKDGVRHLIDGKFVPSRSGNQFDTLNPATNQILARVFEGGPDEIELAAQAARRAFNKWSHMPVVERSRILRTIGDEMLRRKEELAVVETLDTGKAIRDTLNIDVPRSAANFHFFADYIKFLESETYSMDDQAINYTLYQPAGVAGIITPWNYPLLLSTWKIAPCLAFGNTCIHKPAELSPLSASVLAKIMEESDLPPGAFNLVHGLGPRSAGQAISQNPKIDLISFTGEDNTGKAIMTDSAPHLKKLSFELGGKAANIIFADADLEAALESSLQAAYRHQGQVCLAGSRIFVERPIYTEFLNKFVQASKKIQPGDPMDPNTTFGALISQEHLEKVSGYVECAKSDGATIQCGGSRASNMPIGNFYLPTVITDVSSKHAVCQEEVFGPVVTMLPFDTEEEVVDYANGTQYGLSGSMWTQNLRRAHRLASLIHVGTIWVNCWQLRDYRVPLGGVKKSGIGREGGRHSMEFFTEVKNVCIKL